VAGEERIGVDVEAQVVIDGGGAADEAARSRE
jgi:hypothetical protein